MSDPVLYDVSDAVATITLNRPEQLNCLDLAMAARLARVLETAAWDSGVRAIVLTGAGGHFMAGGDINVFHEHLGHGTQDDLVDAVRNFQRSAKLLRRAPKPVIAAVRGVCAGGGMSLMLACDLAIAADDATFSVAYTRIGAPPDGGLSFHLPRIVGIRRAMELALLSEKFDAARAFELSLVQKVVPADRLDAEVSALATRLAAGPTRAFARTKALINQSFSRDMSDQLEAELESFVNTFVGSPDFAEGIEAFLAKREPAFRGR
ncbi:MAG: enoyl-CoA hydratase [Acidobacteria bacterium]|nr:MAG: enoyl-CoA hydratase [Acidobacteriota bacterium]